MHKFCIVRIIGNENPPRDVIGSRLRSLEFILLNEPNFVDTTKLYILNRLVDQEYRRQVIDLLRDHNQVFYEIAFPATKLRACPDMTDDEMNLEVIGINSARNTGIAVGHSMADYAIILDGDCFFDLTGWEEFAQVANNRHSDYYSIPTIRIKPEQYQTTLERNYTEPMPVFYRDSIERFDTSRLFGNCDKLELLFRLGHDATLNSNHCLVHGDKIVMAGYCCHMQTGEDATEEHLPLRMALRQQSMAQLFGRARDSLA